jgi:hypothetical protein
MPHGATEWWTSHGREMYRTIQIILQLHAGSKEEPHLQACISVIGPSREKKQCMQYARQIASVMKRMKSYKRL